MSKWLNDSVLDTALNKISTGTIMAVCSAQPTTRAEAVSTYKIAEIVVDSADFTKSDGTISGRKVTIAQQDNLNVDTTGTATHVAICDGTDLLCVTTCTPQLMTSGNKVTTPAWSIEFADIV